MVSRRGRSLGRVELLRRDVGLGVFAGTELGPRESQGPLNVLCERMRAAEHAPRGPFRVLERRHGLAEVVERGGGVIVEHLPVKPPDLEREFITLAENAPRHGDRFAQQRLGFFEAL